MAGLPRSIIKKYGVSKKAWAVFRGSKSTSSKSLTKSTRRLNMVKRRKGSKSGKKGMFGGLLATIAGSMIYGGVRQKASDALAPIMAKVPAGNYADELVLGAGSYLLYKKTSGILREIGRAGIVIESARVGQTFAEGMNSGGNGVDPYA